MSMIQVGSMWKGKKEGGAFATGQINLPEGIRLSVGNGQRLVLLVNDKKGNDRAPDWRLMLADSGQQESAPPDDSTL